MQADDGEQHERAKVWSKKMLAQFESEAPDQKSRTVFKVP